MLSSSCCTPKLSKNKIGLILFWLLGERAFLSQGRDFYSKFYSKFSPFAQMPSPLPMPMMIWLLFGFFFVGFFSLVTLVTCYLLVAIKQICF